MTPSLPSRDHLIVRSYRGLLHLSVVQWASYTTSYGQCTNCIYKRRLTIFNRNTIESANNMTIRPGKYNATLEKMNRFLNSKCFCIAEEVGVPPWIMVSLSSASPSSWSTCLFTELGLQVWRITKERKCLYSILTSKLLNRVHILSSVHHPVPISNLTCIVNGHHAWRLQIFAFSFRWVSLLSLSLK